MMALADVEPETLVSEPDAITTLVRQLVPVYKTSSLFEFDLVIKYR